MQHTVMGNIETAWDRYRMDLVPIEAGEGPGVRDLVVLSYPVGNFLITEFV